MINPENIRRSNGTIPSNVSRIIKEKGVKRSFVAERLGFTCNQFSALMNGRKLIRACDIAAIANALNVTPNELFGVSSRAAP